MVVGYHRFRKPPYTYHISKLTNRKSPGYCRHRRRAQSQMWDRESDAAMKKRDVFFCSKFSTKTAVVVEQHLEKTTTKLHDFPSLAIF